MAHTRKNERRVLSNDELEFVEKTRHPVLPALSDGDLNQLVNNLRERRDRALGIANAQRRALRGKGGVGKTTYDKADLGNRQKASVLTDALTRARREAARRRTEAAREELIANAHKALDLKRNSKLATRPATLPRPNKGMRRKENQRPEDIGAASEAGRVQKFVAVAQAKKDARGA